MITQLTEPYINKSVMNRHSCISRRRNVMVKQIPSKPIEKNIVKTIPKKPDIKRMIKEESIRQNKKQVINKSEPENVDNESESKQIKELIKQEQITVDAMEDAIQVAVNDVPVKRDMAIEQCNTSKITGDKTVNIRNRYVYNSILGSRVYFN